MTTEPTGQTPRKTLSVPGPKTTYGWGSLLNLLTSHLELRRLAKTPPGFSTRRILFPKPGPWPSVDTALLSVPRPAPARSCPIPRFPSRSVQPLYSDKAALPVGKLGLKLPRPVSQAGRHGPQQETDSRLSNLSDPARTGLFSTEDAWQAFAGAACKTVLSSHGWPLIFLVSICLPTEPLLAFYNTTSFSLHST